MSEIPSVEDIVAQYWPLHGPYPPEQAEAAASTIAELVRYLNYATGRGARQALPYAGSVYTLLGGLTAAVGGLDQTLHQLVTRTGVLGSDPTLRHAQHHDSRHAARADVAAAGESLAAARAAVGALAQALNAAQSQLAWLEHHEEVS